jgi:hypothetical protein
MDDFDLEAALSGRPVFVRKGFPVSQLTQFETTRTPYKLYGTVNGIVNAWTLHGKAKAGGLQSDLDLTMKVWE